ncbi:DNA-binding transcriptional MerR regulator [Actinomycetospora succinea]|uniref:DNA-binding transcriptional MerR regulator n=1 Tax=Actinomycetospora succinea TaxID=663603 RepID=A0A4R6VAM2_9PSEU|nr:DNA-binding transcriptional MerR regulator [Actinomycetospora succinea]
MSQLAGRTGVPASTVRFYEQEGLLPARRSLAGYRLYDDVAVERLAFIGTAKGLGLPLPEIRDLLEPWQHAQCADVQEELIPRLAGRLAETRERMGSLAALQERLTRARAQLDALDGDGPCDPSCALLGLPEEDAAIACTLDAADRDTRLAQWRDLLASITARAAVPGGVRLTFGPEVRPGPLAELAAAEVDCCRFFALTLHLGPPLVLEATAPEDALGLVHELFGAPA